MQHLYLDAGRGFGSAVESVMLLLVRIDQAKNMSRWYSINVQPTLIDRCAVVCSWGRYGGNYQRVQVLPMESFETAREVAAIIAKRKIRRGYSIVRTKKRTVAHK